MAIAIPSRLSCIATTNRSRPRVVSCYAGKQAGAAALGAAVLLLTAAPDVQAVNYTESRATEQELQAIIKARTGKRAALPELTSVPLAKAPAPKAAPTAAVEAEVVPVVTMTVEQKAEAIRNEAVRNSEAAARAAAEASGAKAPKTAFTRAPAARGGMRSSSKMNDSYGNGPAIVAVSALLAVAGAAYGLYTNNNNVAPGHVAMASATPSPEPEMPPTMGDSNNNNNSA